MTSLGDLIRQQHERQTKTVYLAFPCQTGCTVLSVDVSRDEMKFCEKLEQLCLSFSDTYSGSIRIISKDDLDQEALKELEFCGFTHY